MVDINNLNNDEIINLVFHEIDIINQEQMKVAKYNSELEDRRQRLLEFIQKSEKISLTKAAHDYLVDHVSKMEQKVAGTDLNSKGKDGKVCRYHNSGFCKAGGRCKFVHNEHVCEMYQKDGKCLKELCKMRHPKACKFWMSGVRGCFRETSCKYLHRSEQKGIKVRTHRNNSTVPSASTSSTPQYKALEPSKKIVTPSSISSTVSSNEHSPAENPYRIKKRAATKIVSPLNIWSPPKSWFEFECPRDKKKAKIEDERSDD